MKFNSAPINSVTFDGDTQQSAADASTTLVGVESAAAVGSLSVSASADLTLVGVIATGQVGTLSFVASSEASLSAVSATGQVGFVDLASSSAIELLGVATSGEVGELAALSSSLADMSGVFAVGGVGELSFVSDTAASLEGTEATGQVGTFDISVDLELFSVQAAGEVGELSIAVEISDVALVGVETTCGVGDLQAGADALAETPSGLDGAWAPRIIEDRTYRRHSEVRLTGVGAVASVGPLWASVELPRPVPREVLAEVSQFTKLALASSLSLDSLVRVQGVSAEVGSMRGFELLPPELVLDEELEELALLAATL